MSTPEEMSAMEQLLASRREIAQVQRELDSAHRRLACADETIAKLVKSNTDYDDQHVADTARWRKMREELQELTTTSNSPDFWVGVNRILQVIDRIAGSDIPDTEPALAPVGLLGVALELNTAEYVTVALRWKVTVYTTTIPQRR